MSGWRRFRRRLDVCINPFVPNAPFSTPENIRKPYGFLMFSGGQKKGALRTNGLRRDNTENVSKINQKSSFLEFDRILSLLFAGSNLKYKTLQFSVSLCKPYTAKILLLMSHVSLVVVLGGIDRLKGIQNEWLINF